MEAAHARDRGESPVCTPSSPARCFSCPWSAAFSTDGVAGRGRRQRRHAASNRLSARASRTSSMATRTFRTSKLPPATTTGLARSGLQPRAPRRRACTLLWRKGAEISAATLRPAAPDQPALVAGRNPECSKGRRKTPRRNTRLMPRSAWRSTNATPRGGPRRQQQRRKRGRITPRPATPVLEIARSDLRQGIRGRMPARATRQRRQESSRK